MFQDAFCWHHSTGNGLKAIGLDKIQWMEEILHQLNSWGWWFVPWFRGFFTSQVVQEFFHQQYFLSTIANLMFFWMSVYGVYGKASVVSNKYSQLFKTSKKNIINPPRYHSLSKVREDEGKNPPEGHPCIPCVKGINSSTPIKGINSSTPIP